MGGLLRPIHSNSGHHAYFSKADWAGKRPRAQSSVEMGLPGSLGGSRDRAPQFPFDLLALPEHAFPVGLSRGRCSLPQPRAWRPEGLSVPSLFLRVAFRWFFFLKFPQL